LIHQRICLNQECPVGFPIFFIKPPTCNQSVFLSPGYWLGNSTKDSPPDASPTPILQDFAQCILSLPINNIPYQQ